MATTIAEILNRKGRDVVTIGSDRPLRDALHLLEERGIGALVVSDDGSSVDGIISERDVVRVLARAGAESLDHAVSAIMTAQVETCHENATVDEVMGVMTESRFRHLPVVEDGRLGGIISIGDVVKSRMIELELQTENLQNYVTGSSY